MTNDSKPGTLGHESGQWVPPKVPAPPLPPKTKVTETVAAQPLPAVTETVGVDTGVSPAKYDACVRALDLADQGFQYGGEGMAAASDGFQAIIDGDVPAMDAVTTRIQTATSNLQRIRPEYTAMKEQCR
jgi:hypothetical protein